MREAGERRDHNKSVKHKSDHNTDETAVIVLPFGRRHLPAVFKMVQVEQTSHFVKNVGWRNFLRVGLDPTAAGLHMFIRGIKNYFLKARHIDSVLQKQQLQ